MPELTHDTAEDGFHELELSGKQLVFLFMMATVVLVAVFLCGVLVGRNARSPREGEPLESVATAASPAPTTADAPPTAAAEPPTQPPTEKLEYHERLQGKGPREELKKQPETPAPAPPAEKPAAPPENTAVNVPTTGKPGAWFVQVIALQNRTEAASVVRSLIVKGYPAYLELPAAGTPAIYRVRVGRYNDRREADQTARRLKEDKLTADVRR